MTLLKLTHDQAAEARREQWRAMAPDQRVELGVTLSRRARVLEQENGRYVDRVSSLVKRKRR